MFSEPVTQGAGVGFQIILHLGEESGEPKLAIELPRYARNRIGTVVGAGASELSDIRIVAGDAARIVA